jgi:hypothetical protein
MQVKIIFPKTLFVSLFFPAAVLLACQTPPPAPTAASETPLADTTSQTPVPFEPAPADAETPTVMAMAAEISSEPFALTSGSVDPPEFLQHFTGKTPNEPGMYLVVSRYLKMFEMEDGFQVAQLLDERADAHIFIGEFKGEPCIVFLQLGEKDTRIDVWVFGLEGNLLREWHYSDLSGGCKDSPIVGFG